MDAEIVARSSANRRATVRQPSRQRSRATNGTSLFAIGGDMRRPWARRLTDLLDLHLSDLGGFDVTSEAERSIARRICVLEIECERLEAQFAVGEAPEGDVIDLYSRLTNTLRRSLEALGLARRPRDVTTDLSSYIAGARHSAPASSPQSAGADAVTYPASCDGSARAAGELAASDATADSLDDSGLTSSARAGDGGAL